LAPGEEASNYAAIANAIKAPAISISEPEFNSIMAFLKALEDPLAVAGGRMGIPDSVPSGLPIDR